MGPISGDVVEKVLMRRGVEVAGFRYDLRAARVVGKVAVADPKQLPIGTFGLDGRLTRPLFEKWISARAVPFSRAERVASRFGFHTSEELMLSTLGLSLSDQYWFRPADVDVDWESVNPYDNVFDTTLGQALTPEDDESASRAIAVIDGDPTVIYSSPDAACGGNLPKYWCIDDQGIRRLCKSGKAANGIMEPYNEVIATRLCSMILGEGDYVPSEFVPGTEFPKIFSSSPCMVDSSTELIAAHSVMALAPHDNELSLYQKFVSVCERHGVAGAEASLEQMMVVDHILSNFDRHWSNFGVLRDADTNEWLRVAPLFDMGESLWCDRMQVLSLSPHRFGYSMPFRHDPSAQLEAYCRDLRWFDPSLLDGFTDYALETAEMNPFARVNPGFLDLLRRGLGATVAQVTERAVAVGRRPFPARRAR